MHVCHGGDADDDDDDDGTTHDTSRDNPHNIFDQVGIINQLRKC